MRPFPIPQSTQLIPSSRSMGWTSENVSKDFNITRERMDELAAISHQRAYAAQQSGRFDAEILPITVLQLPKTPAAAGAPKPQRVRVTVTADDGIRGDSTKEGLSKIRAAFPQWGNGTTTGGNASQITDGVAGVLLMTRRKAEELGLEIIAKHVCTMTGGLAPRIMGIVRSLFLPRGLETDLRSSQGPSIAIPMALARAGITVDDVDLFEVNEAFASMFGYALFSSPPPTSLTPPFAAT